jgi:hypothetical protein
VATSGADLSGLDAQFAALQKAIAAIAAAVGALGSSVATVQATAGAIQGKTDALPADPASSAHVDALVAAMEGAGFDTADSLAALGAAIASAPAAVWDQLRAAHVAPGTYGELMRLMKQALSGRVKLDLPSGSETVYQEDGATPLQVTALRTATGAPAGLDATERLPVK